jgi:hypothetical protein
MNVVDPWTTADLYADELEKELKEELSDGHILLGKPLSIVARRKDNDDVLVKVLADPPSYAVVHLTWSHQKERVPSCPRTRLYANWSEWVDMCMLPAHNQWLQGRAETHAARDSLTPDGDGRGEGV